LGYGFLYITAILVSCPNLKPIDIDTVIGIGIGGVMDSQRLLPDALVFSRVYKAANH